MESVPHQNGSENIAQDSTTSANEVVAQFATESYTTREAVALMAAESFSSQNSQSSNDVTMDMILESTSPPGSAGLGATTKLIVNYLPQTLSDDEFRGMFLSCGPVKSSKVCRDRETGFSYGFGFVEFVNLADAAKAIELLNGHIMGHKKLKVAYSRPPSRDMHEANLYMRGLPKSWTEEHLKDWCSKYGEIIQVRVLKDMTTGMSRGTGFVLFNRKTEADACRIEMNGMLLPECTEPLVVKVAEGPGGNEQKVRPPPGMIAPTGIPHPGYSQQTVPGAHVPGARYFNEPFAVPTATATVGGPLRTGTSTPRMRYNPMMSSSVKMHMIQQAKQPTSGTVMGYTTSTGSLLSARHPFSPAHVSSTAEMIGLATPILPVAGTLPRPITRPPLPSYTTARSLPMASPVGAPPFVPAPPPPPPPPSTAAMLATFDCPSDAFAHSTATPVGVGSLGPAVQTASHTAAGVGYQLFVYNCGTSCDEKELYELFGPYGAITKVDVVRDPMNGNTKFAFVTMLNYEEASAATQALNGYCYTPRPLQVKFKAANPLGPTPGRT